MEEASLLLCSISEKFSEFVRGASAKEKEMSSRLQELTAKREEEKKEAQNLALKYNEVVIQHNNQMDRAKFLQS